MKNDSLLKKIKNRTARIGIIGLGYVGLPLAILFAKKGFKVTGFVRTKGKADHIGNGNNHLADPKVGRDLKKVLSAKNFSVKVSNQKDLQDQDIIIICVPTPIDENKNPDLTDLKNVGSLLSKINLENKLIVNESTVAPFTTREILGNLGKNYYLVCSPERIDPGNFNKTVKNIKKVIGAKDRESLSLGKELYNQILASNIVEVKSLEAAEMTKMLENTYRAVNIALINEFAKLAEKCDIDILDVITAAKTKWSFHAHYPGIGVGGHCIPVDPHYVLELARKYNLPMKVVEEGLLENEGMPNFIFDKFMKNYKKGMKVLIYGLTYKKNVNDLRESSVIKFCRLLKEEKIDFTVYDPFIDSSKISELGFKQGNLGFVDLFIVGTDHDQLKRDYLKAVGKETIVIDGRNFFDKKVCKRVLGIGRSFV